MLRLLGNVFLFVNVCVCVSVCVCGFLTYKTEEERHHKHVSDTLAAGFVLGLICFPFFFSFEYLAIGNLFPLLSIQVKMTKGFSSFVPQQRSTTAKMNGVICSSAE